MNGLRDNDPHQFGTDSSVAELAVHKGVEYEGMDSTIPGHVHEPHEPLVSVKCAHPAQAVPLQAGEPVEVGDVMTEAFGVQGFKLGVSDVTAPGVGDHETARAAASFFRSSSLTSTWGLIRR